MAGIEILAFILIIAFILLYVLFFYATIRVGIGKRDTLGWIATCVAAIIGVLLISYLIGNINNIVPADWAQILILLGLVGVTGMYAWSTQKMAQEIREQRLSEARPYLLLRLDGEAVQWDRDEQGKPPSREFEITIRNVGKGPATNLWAALWGPQKTYFGDNKGYLAPSEEWQTTISRASTSMVELGIEKEGWLPELEKVITQKYPGIVAVKYNDIHRRIWVSYLCFERHVDVESYVLEEEQNIVELKKK